MTINLDLQSRTPIYMQIEEEIERYIVLGILNPKDQLPSVRELASSLGINPNTVKKAYDDLEAKGTLSTISTKGTFVADDINKVVEEKIDSKIKEIKKLIHEIEGLGVSRNDIIKRL